jgi:hypothetical protein
LAAFISSAAAGCKASEFQKQRTLISIRFLSENCHLAFAKRGFLWYKRNIKTSAESEAADCRP